MYYGERLKKYNVPFELHIFLKGNHGAPWFDNVIWSKLGKGRERNHHKFYTQWLKKCLDYYRRGLDDTR